MTLREYAAYCRKAAKAISANTQDAMQETARQALLAADLLSSGPHSAAQIRAAGHPYARAHPNPSFDPAILNVQSGEFKSAWKSDGPTLTGGVLTVTITNTSKPAQYMVGTRTMRSRPIAQAIADAVQPDHQRRLIQAVQDALNP